jgi:hypothetical protein
MFAGIESLIGLLVFVGISILASWLQKKQRQQGEDVPAPPPRRPRGTGAPVPPSAPPPQKPLSWEEELKKLLEGHLPQEEPPPAPPPPIIVQAPRRTPPAIPTEPAPEPRRHKSVFEVTEERNPTELSVEPTFQHLPGLSQSAQVHQEASQLDDKVQAHLRAVTQRPVGSTHVQHRAATPEASAALALVRNPKSIRSALLASIILGPPRALSE